MTGSCAWHGNVLHAPFARLVEHDLELPPGPPESAPFDQGTWWLKLKREKGGWKMHVSWDDEVVIRAADVGLNWEVVGPADPAEPRPIKVKDQLGQVFTAIKNQVSADYKVSDWNVEEHVKAGSEFSMAVECPSLAERGRKARAVAVTSLLGNLMSSPHPIDVIFFFPHADQELRFSSAILTATSPFFANLLSPAGKGQPADVDDQAAFSIQPAPAVVGQPNPPVELRAFTVTNIDPDSFKALVLYPITSHIKFAPTPPPPNPTGDGTGPRLAKRQKPGPPPFVLAPVPDASPAADWKAVFRAADTLGLSFLKSQALAAFQGSLTVGNVVGELFGPLSAAHREVRAVAVKFARDNREQVLATRVMQDRLKVAKADKTSFETEIALELL